MRQIVLPNFSNPDEFKCRCGCGMDVELVVLISLQAFVFYLQRIYQAPVRMVVSSGARCQARNEATEGSSKFSYHPKGLAADGIFQFHRDGKWIQIDNADVGALALKTGLFTGVGYVRYKQEGKNLVHLDCRPTPSVARW